MAHWNFQMKKQYYYIAIGLISLVAIVAFLVLNNQTPVYSTGETVEYGNGVMVTSKQIRQSNGCHVFLQPNSPLLPSNLEYHGYHIQINYPLVSCFNKQAESIINEQIAKFLGVEWDDLRRFNDGGCQVTVGFDCESVANILAITFTGESYICGAAHGSQWQKTCHFDLATGNTLDVTDLFPPEIDYENALGAIIVQQFKNQNIYDDQWENYHDAESDLVKWIDDWKIRKDGLQIYYMPYMGPAPGGNTTSVIIPYSEIEPLINKESPLWKALDSHI